ncbi:U-box domain-containing protein 8 [Juglans microcarpa x Juglans regia]|uniref:U-box domain-containing protein 8 n=1 Tax=Juglans microcarpa x Juglans regia TaxID=2249226 RepID=UPI001B7E3053|nr:U-box domain-containing protein 8 [Juglans microcarpa x Juglans regia]XP_041027744.1 U-box domain-containing protein 8 [Juglans microcarpa x Juglans regia]XP_041027745.1 U-box domain-containing protein 8 [Juglans microcarpa x Juglans regia]XP_041027746.1 U-box domain-containing protein 8 [Juglans microcarpa x Juglans regia]XP_041027747.1 U-box domain-containing protein 8 [Juglans microcarpa x Juglans regia]XP_041027748.1 U-box domain-containing protein 8 [Juglans microcarpa x Juglans regia]
MATQFPDDFKCPISLEIMSDPVILSSGHTFDRPSIQRWLDAGHRSCPVTKLPLPDNPSLIPNHALRSLISNFALVFPPKPQPYPEPQALISNLTSPSSCLDSKLDSLDQLTKLSKRDSAFRRRITEAGAVSAVLNCAASDNSGLQEKSLSLLLNLSLDDDNKVGLVAEGAISRIVAALQTGSADSRALAATIITSLAVVEVNKATIGAYPYAIRALVLLLRDGKGRGKKEAATALYALCSFPDNRRRAVQCGSVPILIRIADSGLERAVEVLGLLAKSKEGREAMERFNGCVMVLVRVVKNGNSRGIEYALLTLNSLCCHSEEMCAEARSEGVLDLCMGFVEGDNEKIRRNASSLVRVLSGGHSMR